MFIYYLNWISSKTLIKMFNRFTRAWMAPFPSWFWLRNWMWIWASFESHANNQCISRTFRLQTSRRQLSEGNHRQWTRRNLAAHLRPACNNMWVKNYLNFILFFVGRNFYDFLLWIGTVETSAKTSGRFGNWLILVPEQVGEIDSMETIIGNWSRERSRKKSRELKRNCE